MIVPSFHHPCGRREVVVGRWGFCDHPSNCPDCQALDPNSHLGRAIAETKRRIEEAVSGSRRFPASIKKGDGA